MSSFKDDHSFPFDRVIRANIGDCHASGNQVPITYIRQVDLSFFKLLTRKIFQIVCGWLHVSTHYGIGGLSIRY